MGRYRRIAQALPETAYKVNKRGFPVEHPFRRPNGTAFGQNRLADSFHFVMKGAILY